MNHQGEYVKKILKDRKITQEKLAKDLGVSRGQIVKLLNNIVLEDDSIGTISKIFDYLNIDIKDLPYISGDDFLAWSMDQINVIDFKRAGKTPDLDSMKPYPVELGDVSNAKDVGLARSDDDGDTKFTEISPGFWGMMVELVPEYAKAGYLTAYANQEYIDELPKHYFTVDKFVRGKYRAFEISGDSMDNGDISDAIPHGAIVLARELKRDAWRSKLHNHTWPNWVFVHKYEGIICKQIARQDVQNGVLVLRSLNPDRDAYPDITINMDELEQIYNVILRQLK